MLGVVTSAGAERLSTTQSPSFGGAVTVGAGQGHEKCQCRAQCPAASDADVLLPPTTGDFHLVLFTEQFCNDSSTRQTNKKRLPFKAKAMLHLLSVPLFNPILRTHRGGASAENIPFPSVLGSLLGKEEGRRGFPAQQKGSPSPAGPHQRATVGRTCSHAAGASSAGTEWRERPEESREEHQKMSPPDHLPAVGCPGDTARRGKLKEELTGGQGETCCWARACLHIELASGIKLRSGRT